MQWKTKTYSNFHAIDVNFHDLISINKFTLAHLGPVWLNGIATWKVFMGPTIIIFQVLKRKCVCLGGKKRWSPHQKVEM